MIGHVKKKRSKMGARRRVKELWFDTGAAAFERVFPGERARNFPDVENPYICPLCRLAFPKTAIADGTLTFEDAPPKSYGGKPVALTCKSCNHSHGSSLDAPLSTLDSAELSPCSLSMDGIEVNAFQAIGPKGRHFQIPENQNNPASAAQFHRGLETPPGAGPRSLQMTIKWDETKRRRADLAWLKAAYIITFARWGYIYVFSPAFEIIRRQLLHPDEQIISHFKLLNRAMPRNTRFIIRLRQPRELDCVAVGMGHHVVLLPADGRDMTVFSRAEPILSRQQDLQLVGDTYHWPQAPSHSLDVVAFDSRLVLPTPADVRLLT